MIWKGTIAVGRRYRLRNGAVVTIRSFQAFRNAPGFWIGQGVDGTKCTWQRDAWHAPEVGVRPHELDIIGTAI